MIRLCIGSWIIDYADLYARVIEYAVFFSRTYSFHVPALPSKRNGLPMHIHNTHRVTVSPRSMRRIGCRSSSRECTVVILFSVTANRRIVFICWMEAIIVLLEYNLNTTGGNLKIISEDDGNVLCHQANHSSFF